MTDVTTIPVLRSPNLAESRAFYEGLGFEVTMAGPDYLVVARAGIELHFCPPDHQDGRETESSCYIRGPGIDALHAEWAALPGNVVTPIYTRPWGMYEFYVGDPHGCLLKFGRPVAEGPPPEGVLPAHPLDPAGG
ncbi:MAG: VOC family protein [Pseudomonadota bacterium]